VPTVIPFEHNLRFKLVGRPGAKHREVVNVTAGADFIAEEISYFLDIFAGEIEDALTFFLPFPFRFQALQSGYCGHFLAEMIRFKMALIDSGSGREMQNARNLQFTVIGPAGADVPRSFTRPLRFEQRSTIRVELEEVFSFRDQRILDDPRFEIVPDVTAPNGVRKPVLDAVLHLTLHGYKEFPDDKPQPFLPAQTSP
jgi:hypothetical protein